MESSKGGWGPEVTELVPTVGSRVCQKSTVISPSAHGCPVGRAHTTLCPCGQRHAFASLDIKVCLCGPGTTLSQNAAACAAGP